MRILPLLIVPFFISCSEAPKPPASPRLNEIQLIGTHNSYHSGPGASELALLRKRNPKAADSLEYRHLPLVEQLDMGVRQFELDVFGDSKGGLFADPAGPKMVARAGLPADPPFDPEGVLKKPGFKVIHVQDIDFRSNCQPLVNCLSVLRDWSNAHPGHLPIFVFIENKDGKPKEEGYVTPEEITAATFDALDAEIRSVFPAEKLLTPDDVRGAFPSLELAVLRKGWPTVEAARGKFIFLLDQERVTPIYTMGRSALEGRVMFTNG